MKYQYRILNERNEVLYDSKNGIAGKKGFDSALAASQDGELINDMKYPGMATYVRVYPMENVPEVHI